MALRLELPQLIDFQMHRKPGNKIALQTGHVPFVAASFAFQKPRRKTPTSPACFSSAGANRS